MRGPRRVAAALSIACACLAAGPAGADEPPAGSVWSEAQLESRDGTRLHADVFRPAVLAPGKRSPVMLVVSPYLGLPSSESTGPPKVLRWYRRLYEEAIARGYTVAQVSLRGTAASHGCEDLGGPGEQGDVAAAVDWAATQPWSTGAVAMAGHSYDGYAAVIALSQRSPSLAATVLMGPAIDLYRGAYMNGVSYLQGRVVGSYYQGFALIPPPDLTQAPGVLGGRDFSCSPEVLAGSQSADGSTAFWRERDMSERAAGSRVPVFWAHGFLDGRDDYSAVRPSNFLDLWRTLGGPRRAWFGQFPHVVPGEENTWNEPEPVGRDGFTDEALDWLDAHVKDEAHARARVERAPVVAVQEGSRGEWREWADWPPRDGRAHSLPLLPGTYTDAAGNKAEQGDDPGGGCDDGVRARCNPLSRAGQGTWTFSGPLAEDVHLAGTPRLRARLEVEAPAQVVAIVYDVDASSRATLLTRGAASVGATGWVDFELYPQDWRLRTGHRVGVLLAGSDDFYFNPGTSETTVRVEGGSLSLPLVEPPRGAGIGGSPSRAVLERTSFPVEPALVAERATALGAPAGARPSLRMKVKPRRVRARRRVALTVVVHSGGRRVGGGRVRIGRRLVRVPANGVLRVRTRFAVPGLRSLRASRPGYRRAVARIRVVPR